MTAGNRYPLTAAAVVLVATVMVAAPRSCWAANKTERTFAAPVDYAVPARTITFEGGETATVAADDTVYLTEEVAALNATAAAKGDYAYDDYDGTSTDAVPRPFRGRFSPKPAKHLLANDTSVTNVTIVNDTSVTNVTIANDTPVTNMTIANDTPVTNVTIADALSVANATSVAEVTIANETSFANDTIADVSSTAIVTVTTTATPTTTAGAARTVTTTAGTVTYTAAVITTTESGALAQINSPPGYDATVVPNAVSTTPMSSTVSSSSSSLATRLCRSATPSVTAALAVLAISSIFAWTKL